MLRLSIIVPFRNDTARLEATLLSILENRPQGCELIVAHDGTYNDPYALADELTFFEFPTGTPLTTMLNSSCAAADTPNVCMLLDGTVVSPGWADDPLFALEHEGADAVAVQVRRGKQASFGISRSALRRADAIKLGAVELTEPRGRCAGPAMACSFFNRDSFITLQGWSEQLDPLVADVEMAQRLVEAEWDVLCAGEAVVHAGESRLYTASASKDAAQLAACYGLANPSGVTTASELLRGCLSGKLSHSLAWLSGLKLGATPHLLERKQLAADLKDDAEVVSSTRLLHPAAVAQQRRAA